MTDTHAPAQLELRGITKRFGAATVLCGIDLTVARGRVMAVVGPNGAGKTTLIKSMLGLTRPDGGEIAMRGDRIDRDPAYRSRIGYMPQIARYPDNLTGRELLAMLRDLRGHGATVDEELIDRFHLDEQLDKPLRVLSGGTRQKVNAAMAFLFTPELMILDEPTAGLDPLSSSLLKDKILAERSRGRTFIITSHIMNELEELADDVAFLLDGRLRFAGPLYELQAVTHQPTLERAIATLMLRQQVEVAA